MTDILIAPPTVLPLTRTQAKTQMRSTQSTEDALVDLMLQTAVDFVERHCSKALVLQTRRIVLDGFPGCIDGEWGPLRAVQSVQYMDEAGAWQTLATTVYRVDRDSTPWRITLADGQTWPTTYPGTGVVRVNYTAGYLVPFTVPDHANDTLAAPGHGFSDADITQVATIGGTLPAGLAASTNYHVRDAAADTLKLSATAGGAAVDITAAGVAPNCLGILPARIMHALLMMITDLDQHRGEVVTGTIVQAIPRGVEHLLEPFRFWRA